MGVKLFFITALLLSFGTAFSQSIVFSEDFETPENVAKWEVVDKDGDEISWVMLNAAEMESTSFHGNYLGSLSWFFEPLKPDDLLISPEIALPSSGDLSLSFRVAPGSQEFYVEHYAVYAVNAATGFVGTETPILEETLTASDFAGKDVKLNISNRIGEKVKLVFRHFKSSDNFYVGVDDVKVIHTDAPLSTSDIADKGQVSVYPNPAQRDIHIHGVSSDLISVSILDLSGKLLLTSKVSDVGIELLKPGAYLVRVETKSGSFTKKVIKK